MTESGPEPVAGPATLRDSASIGYSMSDPAPHAYQKLTILRTLYINKSKGYTPKGPLN